METSRYNILPVMFTTALGGFFTSYALFGKLLAACLGATVGALTIWAEDRIDPFHRYPRAVYKARVRVQIPDEGTDVKRGDYAEMECIVKIIEESPGFYRIRFPLSWKLRCDHADFEWVAKNRVTVLVD